MPATSAFDLVKSSPTCTSALTPTQAQHIVIHAEASRYVAMASFTLLVWDHLCTFKEEVELLWPAPRSLIKVLFLWNRYITPIFMAVTVYEMSRLHVSSDTFCKAWVVVNGFIEMTSIATSDLQLLFRIHALWGGRRSIVVGTLVLHCMLYACMAAVAIVTAIDIIPHLRFDLIARQCFTDHKPKVLPAQWAVSIIRELVVLVMTVLKWLQNRDTDQTHTPLMKVLFYDQIMYYIIIVCEHSFINNQDVWTENQIPFSTGGASFPSIQSCCLAHSIPLPVFSEHFFYLGTDYGNRITNHAKPSARSRNELSRWQRRVVLRWDHSNRFRTTEHHPVRPVHRYRIVVGI